MSYKNKCIKYITLINKLDQKGGLSKEMQKRIESRKALSRPREYVEVMEDIEITRPLNRIQDLENFDKRDTTSKILDINLGEKKESKEIKDKIDEVLDINQPNHNILTEKDMENQRYYKRNIGESYVVDTEVEKTIIFNNDDEPIYQGWS